MLIQEACRANEGEQVLQRRIMGCECSDGHMSYQLFCMVLDLGTVPVSNINTRLHVKIKSKKINICNRNA
jgi:hypothetical protein